MEKLANKVLVEAAAWCVHLSEADAQTTPEFEHWLQADAAHGEAWARVEPKWNIFKPYTTAPEVLALRRAALADAHDVARQRWASSQGPSTPNPKRLTKRWLFTLAAAASLLVAACVWYFMRPELYRTHIGEQRVIALADGSKVHLDSATELSIDYSSHERSLTLNRGQARFDVAHDGARPFIVTAGAKKVVATGTAFNIDVLGSRVLVTLIEGDVLVIPRNSTHLDQSVAAFAHPQLDGRLGGKGVNISNGSIELVAGQELVASADGTSKVSGANIARVTSWQKGQLLFDDEPLSSVVERVNRYASKPIVLTDDKIRQLRISGVFATNDIPGFITTITHYLPLTATMRQNSIDLAHR
jgi:transmembrane sensor